MSSKRNIFIINPAFQYKFCLYVCTFVFLSSLIYPLTIYDIYDKVIALQPHRLSSIQESRTELLFLLSIIQVSLIGIVFVLCIFMSHKIAGPMFKLKTHLEKIRHGEPFSPLFFRKGDNFKEVADEINEFFDFVRENNKKDFHYLQEVNEYIKNLEMVLPEDKKPVISEIVKKLEEISKRYKTEE